MKISVVIPCHNSSEFLAQALDSVAAQLLPAHEVIVIDDRSTDDSSEIAKNHRVNPIVLTSDHGNAAPTRNVGVERASGDWVAFLDADNVWLSDHLSRAAELLDQSGDVLFVAPPTHETDEPPNEFGQIRDDYAIGQPATGLKQADFVDWRLNKIWGFPTTGTVAKLARVREIGGFDVSQRRRHDFELVMRVIAGQTWCATPVATWWSRPVREGNISADKPACAYYAYRALHLNRECYDSEAYRHLLRRSALNATKNAIYSQDDELIRKAKSLAGQDLGLRERIKLAIFGLAPPKLRTRMIKY